jgi:hypothetical protein
MSNPKYLQQGFDKRLAHAIEECGEFLAAAGKLQRWGAFSVNPELPREMQEFNIDWVFREAKDVQEAIERLLQSIQTGEHKGREETLAELEEDGRR